MWFAGVQPARRGTVLSGKSRLRLLGGILGSALAVIGIAPMTALAGEGNGNYLGILSSSAPSGYTPSPAAYSLAQGQNLLTFQFNVTNLTAEQQTMSLQLNLDRITVYQGLNVSDGQPGVVNGAVVDGQFNEQLATEIQDPNPTFSTLSIGPNATQTVQMSRTLPAGQCSYYQVDVAKAGLTSQKGLIGFEIRVLGCGSPSISTTPSPTSGVIGVVIHDMATVTGGLSPTGTVNFALFSPGDTTCSGTNLVAGAAGFVNVPLSGGSATSAGYTTTQVGVYNWLASYSGDVNNHSAVSACGAEQVTVGPASPAIATTPSPTQGTVGVVISDSASVTGGFSPTGTVTFALFGPGDSTCAGPNLVAALSGFANVALSGGSATSAGFTTTLVGTYNWTASYSGDANNNPAVSACGAEQVTVTKPLGGQGCTPGFWKNPKHFSLWSGYSPSQLVSSVFNVPAVFPDGSSGSSLAGATLAGALAFQGGNTLNGASQILLRASVAALLNASNSNIAYPMTTSQIISAVNSALNSGDRTTITNLATLLDNANNGGCPLS